MKNNSNIIILIFLIISITGNAQNSLRQNFQNPPNVAKPRVWWHWMNGNITIDGIRKDLEWMNRIEVGGFHNFDASLGTPQIVKERLTYMTPKWKEAFKFTTNLADKLGLEMAIAASPGWSVSGGPWVPEKDGMKKYVWSEIRVKGGQVFNGTLPKPPITTGKFQDLPIEESFSSGSVSKVPIYYQDISTVAFKIPDIEKPLSELDPTITSIRETFTLDQLTIIILSKTNILPSDPAKGYAWIQYHFDKQQIIKAMTVVGGDKGPFGLFGSLKEKRVKEKAEELLVLLGLQDRIHNLPSQMSGGEQQHTAVARALINSPSIDFADEPLGNLYSKNAQELHQLFFDLRDKFNQTSVIVSTIKN